MRKNELKQRALLAGETYYTEVKACKRCGLPGERYTNTGACVRCQREKNAAYLRKRYQNDPAFVARKKKAAADWYVKFGVQDRKLNYSKYAASCKKWWDSNKGYMREVCTKWRRNNLDKLSNNAAAYRSSKIQATPLWADPRAIQEWYSRANTLSRSTGIQHTVDHIIPLNHQLVCGLHVETNLQILTLSDNSAKSNKYNIT